MKASSPSNHLVTQVSQAGHAHDQMGWVVSHAGSIVPTGVDSIAKNRDFTQSRSKLISPGKKISTNLIRRCRTACQRSSYCGIKPWE